MICPVEIARDMSALRAVRIRDHAEHGSLSEGRDGAGDESTGRDVTGDGEEDHVVAGGGDPEAFATGTCGVGGSATWKRDTTDCWTGGGASRRGAGWRWRRWRKCSPCTGRSISIWSGLHYRSGRPSSDRTQ